MQQKSFYKVGTMLYAVHRFFKNFAIEDRRLRSNGRKSQSKFVVEVSKVSLY